MGGSKYTVSGSGEIDGIIDSHMKSLVSASLAEAGEDPLCAIVLGGGYGRGEGGVTVRDGKECLYNDYDLFMLSKGLSRRERRQLDARLKKVAEDLSGKFGIEVDFSPLKNASDLAGLDYEMVWFEGKKGHVVLWGDKDVFGAIPDWKAADMPHTEAARLLMNRGMGLILAERRILGGKLGRADLEFVERNAWKAVMASGDVHLILSGLYDPSYVRRGGIFKGLPEDPAGPDCELRENYAKSIAYKLSPPADPADGGGCADLLLKAKKFLLRAYLPVASSLCGRKAEALSQLPVLLPDLTPSPGPVNRLKSCALNLLSFGAGSILFGPEILKHPRSRVFAAVPYFLGAGGDPAKVDSLLGCSVPGNGDEDRFSALKGLWERFS